MARLASALVLLGVAVGVGADAPVLRKASAKAAPRRPKAAAAAGGRAVHLHAQARQPGNATKAAPQPAPGPAKQQTVRLCNAYPDGSSLSVWHDDGDSLHMALTGAQPIATKTCREFVRFMGLGDFLELRLTGQRSPIYIPYAPVQENSVALAVVYEKEKGKPAVWLHYFDHLTHPQVAAVDATGRGGNVNLVCVAGSCNLGKQEGLPAGSVTPVLPGKYSVSTPEGSKVELDALNGGSYAVLVMSGEAVVYPSPQTPHAYGGAAGTRGLTAALFVLCMAAAWVSA